MLAVFGTPTPILFFVSQIWNTYESIDELTIGVLHMFSFSSLTEFQSEAHVLTTYV